MLIEATQPGRLKVHVDKKLDNNVYLQTVCMHSSPIQCCLMHLVIAMFDVMVNSRTFKDFQGCVKTLSAAKNVISNHMPL